MTIKENVVGHHVRCQWFAGSKLESDVFPIASLIVAEAKSKKGAENKEQ